MLNNYNNQLFFEVTTNKKENIDEVPAVDVAPTSDNQVQFAPIYENPDKFFIYFLSKVKIIFWRPFVT